MTSGSNQGGGPGRSQAARGARDSVDLPGVARGPRAAAGLRGWAGRVRRACAARLPVAKRGWWGYSLVGSLEPQSGRCSALLPARGPERFLGAAGAVKVERQTAKALAGRADGKKLRQAGLLGWGCGIGSDGWSPPEGQGVAQPGGWLGPCCTLQDGGGTALRGAGPRGGSRCGPGFADYRTWFLVLLRVVQD